MSASCCHSSSADTRPPGAAYKRVLWTVLAVNAAMFLIEIIAGLAAGSASLQAVGNYAISLAVVGLALRYRAMVALAKGVTMVAFGVWVAGTVIWHAVMQTVPEPITMGAVGFAAITANAACAVLLYAYRRGDANMQSVWICSRNDVAGNFAVLLAALGVFGTGTGWPDLVVAALMAALALQGAWIVARKARQELHSPEGGTAFQVSS